VGCRGCAPSARADVAWVVCQYARGPGFATPLSDFIVPIFGLNLRAVKQVGLMWAPWFVRRARPRAQRFTLILTIMEYCP
jgi:hypothetical protein